MYAGLKGHQKNADIEGRSCGNEPGDAVSDSMRNSQDGSFHYSGRSEVSLPQVDLEPSTRRDHRLSSDSRMRAHSSQKYALRVLRLHAQRVDRSVNIHPPESYGYIANTCNIIVKKCERNEFVGIYNVRRDCILIVS